MTFRIAIRRALGAPLLATAGTLTVALTTTPAAAQETRLGFDIPAGDLGPALEAFARRAGLALTVDPALVTGRSTRGLRGSYTVAEGFGELLAGTGLEREITASGAIALRPMDGNSTATLARVVVEGVRPGDESQSAAKMPLSIRETPQSISVVSRASIEARQALDVGSAIELTAGVAAVGKAFAGNNPRTGEDFYLRGQELDASRDIRIDGFSAGGDRNNFDLAPFESVEVVKGAVVHAVRPGLARRLHQFRAQAAACRARAGRVAAGRLVRHVPRRARCHWRAERRRQPAGPGHARLRGQWAPSSVAWTIVAWSWHPPSRGSPAKAHA